MKKILSIILVLCMAVLVVPFSAFATQPTEQELYIEQMGYAAQDSGWIALASAADFAKIGVENSHPLTGKYYVTANITPPTNAALVTVIGFAGILDGCGYSVVAPASKISSQFCLMNKNAAGAEVKNLTFGADGAPIKLENTTNLGIVLGSTAGKIIIDNVHVYAEINDATTSSRSNNVGAFIGKVDSVVSISNSTAKIKLTTANASYAHADKHFGGFVGTVVGGKALFLSNCTATVTNGGASGDLGVAIGTPSHLGNLIGAVNADRMAVIHNCTASGDGTATVAKKANTAKVLDLTLNTLDGAYIKYAKPKTAMKFEAQMNTTQTADLVEAFGAEKVKSGMLVDGVEVAAAEQATNSQDGTTAYYALINDITSADYATAHTARAFMAFNISSTSEIWIYIYAASETERSVAQVAQKVLDDELTSTDEKYTEKLGILVDFGAQKGE